MGKVIKDLEEAQGCIICGQTKEHGIMIISEFICEDCEHEMVQTDVMDAKYPFFIRQMKRIFYKKNA
ncbi:Inhibitor of sigma-G Gin [Paenibacillus sp. 1_12]|uniref:sigma factor G inhibitor Gin n=1 Tax=Paenibacillus sp. 1_12 TaxID=1566278 RepID=UPI0008F30FE8|nr:sigma factor G inhibitor Gin [Paenibacillus sp. 1_12]SFM32535.1 Inhibitor of sigma-G Gin [Paenibacillus sp. 1_12]